jgi:GT2 family glycosyltransferase
VPSRVSVIIPNLNSLIIGRTLAALRYQEFDLSRVEVLVIGLDEPGLVQADELVRLISTDGPAPPAVARNIGAQEAKGDLLCLIDADCIPHRLWLQTLLACYDDPEVTIVGGGVTFPSDRYWCLADNIATFYPYLHTSPSGIRDQLPSLNLSFRREVWNEVGPFDERYPRPAGEDADWTTRARLAGHRLYFEPKAVVIHYPMRTTFGDLWHHAVDFGQYSIKVDERYRAFLRQPSVFRHWLLTLLAAPAMSAWVVGRIFFNKHLWRYFHTLPAIYLAKLGWCWGASKRLRGQVEWYQPHLKKQTKYCEVSACERV